MAFSVVAILTTCGPESSLRGCLVLSAYRDSARSGNHLAGRCASVRAADATEWLQTDSRLELHQGELVDPRGQRFGDIGEIGDDSTDLGRAALRVLCGLGQDVCGLGDVGGSACRDD